MTNPSWPCQIADKGVGVLLVQLVLALCIPSIVHLARWWKTTRHPEYFYSIQNCQRRLMIQHMVTTNTIHTTETDTLLGHLRLQALAQQYLIAGMDETTLVRRIQLIEQHVDCFATPRVHTCGEFSCPWREDCLAKNGSETL